MISKNICTLILAFLVSAFSYVQAQKIEYQGKKYLVKGETVFLDKQDITSSLSYEDQMNIKNALIEKLANEKIREAEKAQKKAEKELKKSEKARKKTEKELKRKVDAQNDLTKSQKKYNSASSKYEKLKKRGKLLPEEDLKWQEKLEKLQKDIKNNKNKLNKLY